MYKKAQTNNIYLIGVILILIVGATYFLFSDKPNDPEKGAVNKEGLCVPEGRAGIGFATCCFDAQEKPIACKPSPNQQAIFNSQSGVYYVAYGASITNNGNVVFNTAKITSISVSPTNTELNTKFNSMVNQP